MDKEFDRAWKLIAAPERWCKGIGSMTVEGFPCFADDPRAARWCATGAMVKVYPGKFLPTGFVTKVVAMNDAPERTHTEVVEWLKERDL